VEGDDAACKLTLLSRMAFGQDVPLEAVPREGITRLLPCDFVYAGTLGRTPRLLGTAALLPGGRLAAGVRVHMVSRESILAKVVGPFNAVLVKGAFGGEFAFYGRGAGGDPTATAVLADVVELARSGYRALVPPLAHARLSPHAPASAADFRAPFYVRFVVRDRPGIIAGISRCLADHEINIDAVFQAPYEDKEALPFVVTLEEVAEDRLLTALGEIEALPFHVEPPLALPMTGSAG
jgi:homoserine dehydrogenase